MKTVAITSPTGMLGSMVYKTLKDKYSLVLIYRDEEKLKILDKVYGKVNKHKKIKFDLDKLYDDYITGFSDIGPNAQQLAEQIGPVDGIINCTGITKPRSLINPLNTLFINGMLPHILSRIYKDKLIQITTDCVYNGRNGAPYDENSSFSPNDLYGFSKSLGEPSAQSLVLRTSIIGPEITGFYLLISWFKKQQGKTIQGYTNHFWNGVTTKQFALICDKIFTNRGLYPQNGLFHIFSTTISKYEMLLQFKNKYKVDCNLIINDKPELNRCLATHYSLNKQLDIPDFSKMLDDLS